jgi:hypothetical protein
MSRRQCLIAIGCFLLGLVLGVGGGMTYSGKSIAGALALLKEIELTQSGDRAFEAYQRESRPVAIYALTQHLKTLEGIQDIGSESPAFLTRLHVYPDTAFTHARLAKLYEADGQTQLAGKHAAAALHHIAKVEKFSTVTNRSGLLDVVARFDERGGP